MKKYFSVIKKLGFIYIIKVIIFKLKSLYYKFVFLEFWKGSYVFWWIDLFNRWNICVWERCIIESSYNKSHFWCDIWWTIKIWNNCFLNQWIIIDAWPNLVNIWNNVKIWPNVIIMSVDNHGEEYGIFKKTQNIIIWNNTWIWANAIILPWVVIWDNTIIWAGSIVTKNQPSNTICAGNPCKFIKNI